jgi:nicotinamide riboside transporter PnuC
MSATSREDVRIADRDTRIERMHGRDRMGALAFVAVLWLVILFTLFTILPEVTNGAISTILLIAGGLVLIFNTAAIIAMLRHYTSDKHFIYSLDLLHLDEMRRRKRL